MDTLLTDTLLADILLANTLPDAYGYVGTIIEVIDEFKERLVKKYSDNKQWKQIINMLKSPLTTDTATAGTRLREDRRAFYLLKYNNTAHYVFTKAGI